MDFFRSLLLKGVVREDSKELGRGTFGIVYTVKYCQMICAAKEVHAILDERDEMRQTQVESFTRECHQWSELRHPNIVQFLGVYFPASGCNQLQLPAMIMEMMADTLTLLVKKYDKLSKVPICIKFSIVHDVSLGLCYLHNHDPPIAHHSLNPNNILLTAQYVAKISDIGVNKMIKAGGRKITEAPRVVDFMPPEILSDRVERESHPTAVDVFSFAGIVLHTFSQQWPYPCEQVKFDSAGKEKVVLSEVERRRRYLDEMQQDGLKLLTEECLDDDPAMRPTITAVCERIQASKIAYMKEFPQDNVMKDLKEQQVFNRTQNGQDVDQLKSENNILKSEIELLKSENQHLKQQMSSTTIVQTGGISTMTSKEPTVAAKLRIEAPPLIPALASGRYRIKWTQLTNLPAPMFDAYVTVHDKKLFVAGGTSPAADAQHHVYVYDMNTNHWDQLPSSGHCFGVPHIIGGKLAIIGGRLSVTKKRTNKVSTFDETSQAWTSYYPDLLSVRNRPGVVTHLEHVIVAGGVKGNDIPEAQDDIEILNWVENSQWRKISVNLPEPMWAFTPIIADNHLVIVGYDANMRRYRSVHRIPISVITRSGDYKEASDAPTKWVTMTTAIHWHTALIPNTSPPVIVGGRDQNGAMLTADIKMYNYSSKSWKNVASLSSARSSVAITTVNNNAIVVIGGCIAGGNVANAKSSSLTAVELGQAQLMH